jgi:kynurenine formamidase
MAALPRYEGLPTVEDTGEAYAWTVWPVGDELGTINFLTPDRIAAAAALVRDGVVVNLTLPLDEPKPGLFPERTAYVRHEELLPVGGRDDSVSDLFLQGSSQWDGLRHIRHRTAGYYGGRDDAALDDGALGIDVLARHGVVGRGVLIDLAAAAAARGTAPDERWAVDGPTIESIAQEQGVEVRPGDILVLHTGWTAWYLAQSAQRKKQMVGSVGPAPDGLACTGLAGHVTTAEWLWNHEVAAVVADNPAVEALPVDRAAGFLHRRLIPLFGMPLGELWWLDELAERCRATSRYEFLLVSAPLNLPGGVGSPANAVAVL